MLLLKKNNTHNNYKDFNYTNCNNVVFVMLIIFVTSTNGIHC